MKKKGLRFGIIYDNIYIEGWQLNCIKKMLENELVEVGLMILIDTKQSKQTVGKELLRSILTIKTTSFTNLTNDFSIIECHSEKTETGEDHFTKADLEKVKSYELNFILNLSSKNIGGEIVNLPEFGVWEFQNGSNLTPYFWGIYNEEPVSFAALHLLSHQNEQIILKKGYFSTIKDSYKKNREHITSAISDWPAQV
ncbi:hypothetical protein V7157_28520, partial [Neobacillus drentensis]|uniref:hypothetical protein n=1 Tax=Neobacillus drentensis TaxID=220684 RepID=UPI0030038B51